MALEPLKGHAKHRVVIHAGEWFASTEPAAVYTLLGSCVAVCLYDPVARIGGMNHILLPGKADFNHFDAPTRYGINAMDTLIGRLLILGARRDRILAKAFGGGHVLVAISKDKGVGMRNVAFVRHYLETERIRLVGEDLGGFDTRRIWFHTDSGEVYLKRTRMDAVIKKVLAEEDAEIERIRENVRKQQGDITFFNDGKSREDIGRR